MSTHSTVPSPDDDAALLAATLTSDQMAAHRRVVLATEDRATDRVVSEHDGAIVAIIRLLHERGAFEHDPDLAAAMLRTLTDTAGVDEDAQALLEGRELVAVEQAEDFIASLPTAPPATQTISRGELALTAEEQARLLDWRTRHSQREA